MVHRSKPRPMAIGAMVPNEPGHLDIRRFMSTVAELENKTGFSFGLPQNVATAPPDAQLWPARVLIREFTAPPKEIDDQCPKAR